MNEVGAGKMSSQSADLSSNGMRRRPSLLARFRRNKRGSVAVEFSMLILPFTLLMFAVIETSVSFAAQQLMSNVTDDLARSMRTGKIKPVSVSPAIMRNSICDGISLLVPSGCPELVYDLRTYADYDQIPLRITYLANGDIDTTGFKTELGTQGAIQGLRVYYRWPIMTDFMRGKLSTLPDGKTLLYSAMYWKNEPYL
jgi:Flp pilus assembly protein TadG